MNTKRKLNCYVFSNLIISFLTLNLFTNPSTTLLISKTSTNTLNKIYEKEAVGVINVPDTIISSYDASNIVISISKKNVQSEKTISYVKPSYNSVTGSALVEYAKHYLGLRYVSAGNSLETGTDCSGFTRLIYKEFGINLGRTVSSQLYSGSYVSKADLQPGDIVFYSYGSVASHVAIYMGNGLVIHESNPRDGVKISSVNIMNYITARRLITSNIVKEEKKVEIEEVKEEKIEKEEIKELPKEEKKVETNIEKKVEDIKVEAVKDENINDDTIKEKSIEISKEESNDIKIDTESSEINEEKKEEIEEVKEEKIDKIEEKVEEIVGKKVEEISEVIETEATQEVKNKEEMLVKNQSEEEISLRENEEIK